MLPPSPQELPVSPLLLLLACAADPAGDTAGLDPGPFPAPPEDGLQIVTPELEIPAYSERQYCFFGTYTGPDVGLHATQGFQQEYGHHVLLMGTNYSAEDFPDGELIDCTDEDSFDMLRVEPMLIQGSYDSDFAGSSLPPGMAIEMESGQRWVLQAHYVNASAQDLLVQDAVNLAFIAADQVETWAATFAHSTIGFDLPPGQETSVTVACEFDEELSVMNLSGHLHERGRSHRLEHTRGGDIAVLYDVPDWQADYRDDPPVEDFGGVPYPVLPGDLFTTTCTWFNDTEAELGFPEEMCATAGVVFPRREGLTCVDL